jgi:hypothetical protein
MSTLRTSGLALLPLLALGACGGTSPQPEVAPSKPPPVMDANMPVEFDPPANACPRVTVERNVDVAGFKSDVISFGDAHCKPRSAAMAQDKRGFLRRFTYEYDGKTRSATGAAWDGFGFIVNHNLPGKWDGEGTAELTWAGANHAIYTYVTRRGPNDSVLVTRQWLIAAGRDNPVIAITYDMTVAKPGINADTRTPYGDIAWDGDEIHPNTVVTGVGWGDHYKFKTTSEPLTLNSSWDYSEENLVPYCMEWSLRKEPAVDAEMGLVQTQTRFQKDAGGYWFFGNWGKTSANPVKKEKEGQIFNMPLHFDWPYQLNQYELCYRPKKEGGLDLEETKKCMNDPTNSHRISWGANYGAIGGDKDGKYASFGSPTNDLVGYPYNSYSIFMVLGKHTDGPVAAQVKEIETVQKTKLEASVGSVITELPAGVARTDLAKLDPPGYDARFSTWNLRAQENAARFSVSVEGGPLENPVLVIHDYTQSEAPKVRIDGKPAVSQVDFLPSVDVSRKLLWITLRGALSGKHEVAIGE